MEEIQINKEYSLSKLKEIFNIGNNKNGTETIDYISRYYELKKVRRGMYKIIRELSEIEKLENQTYHKHRDYIEPMIYSMLLNTKSNSFTMDMHQIMESVEIVNKDFHYIKYHTKECSEIMNQETDYGLNIFTRESEPMLKQVILDVFNEMEDRQLIKINKIPVVAYRIYDMDKKEWYISKKGITKDKDIQHLLEVKRKILKEEFGLEKESDINYYQQGEFRDLIAKEYDAEYFYYKYNIILNKTGLTKCERCDIIELKKSFNRYIQAKLKKSKQGNLKILTKEEKNIYIKYCIDTSQDSKLRLKERGK